MASSRLCSIPDCSKPHEAHGWCSAHYQRQRKYGDPLGGGPEKGQAQRFYREVVLTDERGADDPCLIWPFTTHRGYAKVKSSDEMALVSRLVCEERHGPAPTPDHEAAHSCGKGQLSCVTKAHLRWATRKENAQDTVAHGTSLRGERNRNARLTAADVRRIRAIKDRATKTQIAGMYGVTRSNVGHILSGRSWSWLP